MFLVPQGFPGSMGMRGTNGHTGHRVRTQHLSHVISGHYSKWPSQTCGPQFIPTASHCVFPFKCVMVGVVDCVLVSQGETGVRGLSGLTGKPGPPVSNCAVINKSTYSM